MGRLKEIIIRGGENISPLEVEDVLLRTRPCREAVSFGVADEKYGQLVGAAVALEGEATERELVAHCRERLAAFKVPDVVHVVDAIPRTPTGKVQRKRVGASLTSRRRMTEPNAFEVDLGAIRSNVRELRRLVGPDCALFAALKCNAYGFGLARVARALDEAGADALAVARVRDAIALRNGGVALPILLYGAAVATAELVEAVERFELTPTALDAAAAEVFSRHATRELARVPQGRRRPAPPRRQRPASSSSPRESQSCRGCGSTGSTRT